MREAVLLDSRNAETEAAEAEIYRRISRAINERECESECCSPVFPVRIKRMAVIELF